MIETAPNVRLPDSTQPESAGLAPRVRARISYMKFPDVEDLRRVSLKGPNLRHQDVFHSVGMQQYRKRCFGLTILKDFRLRIFSELPAFIT
jgi:hypothetical protein